MTMRRRPHNDGSEEEGHATKVGKGETKARSRAELPGSAHFIFF
jgi:hypothetical protein